MCGCRETSEVPRVTPQYEARGAAEAGGQRGGGVLASGESGLNPRAYCAVAGDGIPRKPAASAGEEYWRPAKAG